MNDAKYLEQVANAPDLKNHIIAELKAMVAQSLLTPAQARAIATFAGRHQEAVRDCIRSRMTYRQTVWAMHGQCIVAKAR